jgi:hypothetical protein
MGLSSAVFLSYDTMVAKLLSTVFVVGPDYLQVMCGGKHILSI